ncbi:MAG: RES family NAD+ phosphorylase [Actinomycetota bacterium]
MPPPDPELIQAVDASPRSRFSGEAYRHVAPSYPALGGQGARIQGGRWNPPESFPVLYLAIQRECVVAEFFRFAERSGRPPEELLPRTLHHYRVELGEVLDLRGSAALGAVGLTAGDVQSDDPGRCQRVGEAAHYVGFEAVLAPSATLVGHVLAVFTDRLHAGSTTEPLDHERWDTLPPRPRP